MKKLLLGFLSLLLIACAAPKEEAKKPTVEKKEDDIREVSFLAVGDNLIHEAIYYYNIKKYGSYQFDDIYKATNYLTQAADIAYINQETIVGGEELGLSGYPTFNGPHAILDAVHNAGFDWVSGSSNHSFDRGEQGVINELNYLDQFPEMKVTGIHRSQEEADEVQYFESNGVTIGIQGYTYGLNGFELPDGKEYLVNLTDKERIQRDIEKLKKRSDIQIVSMHWGEEYQFSPNQEQIDLAQYLSDLGVDVIIGSHPHVIQPMDYLKGKNGNETLVIYSLGNFLSAQDENYRMLGGLAKWNIQFNKTTKEATFKDVQFLPVITHITNNFQNYETYALKDYTDELASQHTLRANQGQDISRQYFIDLVHKVMNDKIEIVY